MNFEFPFAIFVSVMAGLYFHIPFCRRICAYCDFFRSADLRYMPLTVETMCQELREESGFISDRNLHTIYFGGGTPSLLQPSDLQRFVADAEHLFDCGGVEEITTEANPDDITAHYVKALRLTDINRVSLGVQSFDDRELQFMNRRHSAMQASDAVKRLQDSGIENITIDLIFGVDGFGEDVLSRSLEQAVGLGVQHISAYHLTIEPQTVFHRRLMRGDMREVSEERSLAEYALIDSVLSDAGFEHYEVSNYAREGFRSRHNSSYWQGVQYLGVGAGAHSFNGEERRWCRQPLKDYVVARQYEGEVLSPRDCFNEYVMTSLRRIEGVDLQNVEVRFGRDYKDRLVTTSQSWIEQGVLRLDGNNLHIPTSQFMLSDAVIESLFDV